MLKHHLKKYCRRNLVLKNKIKVLQVGAENFGRGGRSVIAYNLAMSMDPQKIENDFLSLNSYEDSKFVRQINRNGNVLFVNRKGEKFKYSYLVNEVKKRKYDIAHIHADNAYEALKMALLMRAAKINKIIIHAHNDNVQYSRMKNQIIKVCKIILPIIATEKLACTQAAGTFMFGKKTQFTILKDGIDVRVYTFNKAIRTKIRKEFNWNRDIIIGTVARLAPQKNLFFLLKVFKNINIKNKKLVIVGSGNELQALRNISKNLNISEKVFFLGNRDNVNELLQGFDIFILPSIYEGFGMAAIEAQASGLPTIVSDKVPIDTQMVSRLYYRKNLSAGIDEWARLVEKISTTIDEQRQDTSDVLIDKGYDISESAKQLEKIYMKEKLGE